jgi:sucrose-phosphate synthase
LYIQLYSIHGLVRGQDLELGRNADTGGQVKYVLELAHALAAEKRVRKVDIFTRLIEDKTLSPLYSRPIEQLGDKLRIVRIRCGGRKYIRKELLWPHLDEYIDRVLGLIKRETQIPDFIHGHYADAGYVGKELAALLGTPFIFTGHSLGKIKQRKLLQAGIDDEEIEAQYNISRRIGVEEECLAAADLVIASTRQERDDQYGAYDSQDSAHFQILPPGIELSRFFPFYDESLGEIEDLGERDKIRQAQFYINKELERFLGHPEKPIILALARPDQNKNITGLVQAYGMDKELQAIANLAVFAGIRKDITAKDENERQVLTELLLLMDKYDLYGRLAIPKKHEVEYEVPELYRTAARSGGVFVNPAFNENFGLTLIEAAASGLPIVATNDGGPRDIIENCQNGILADPRKPEEISGALKKILVDPDLWKRLSEEGVRNVRTFYTWNAHCSRYLERLQELKLPRQVKDKQLSGKIGKHLARVNKLFITDIDNTLIGDDRSLKELNRLLQRHHQEVAFGVATGRNLALVVELVNSSIIPPPDIIICSVGTEIYYGVDLLLDKSWRSHIAFRWNRERLRQTLAGLDCLSLQSEEAQKEFKLSYLIDDPEANLHRIHHALTEQGLRYNLIVSSRRYLDILPSRASKGKAIRYLHRKWNIPLDHILVAGDSGNDEEMLRGEMLAIVVGNHSAELEKLRGLRHIYFSRACHAAGILEGSMHYKFFNEFQTERESP